MHKTLAQIIKLLEDSTATELLCNGAAYVYLTDSRGLLPMPPIFSDDHSMAEWLQDFAWSQGIRLDPQCGFAGGTWVLKECDNKQREYRWHALLTPLSRDGPLFTLRKHRFQQLGLADFSIEPEVRRHLSALMLARRNLLIVGPTNSGKTSLLVALLAEYASDERVICIESTPELPQLSPAWVRLVARRASIEGRGEVTMRCLITEALRLRPDRLVVGEIRSSEAGGFLTALHTGHGGSLATMHAGSAAEAHERLLSLIAEAQLWLTRGSMDDIAHAFNLSVVVMQRGQPPSIASVT